MENLDKKRGEKGKRKGEDMKKKKDTPEEDKKKRILMIVIGIMIRDKRNRVPGREREVQRRMW